MNGVKKGYNGGVAQLVEQRGGPKPHENPCVASSNLAPTTKSRKKRDIYKIQKQTIMKKILLGLVLILTMQTAFAQIIKPIPKPKSYKGGFFKPLDKPDALKLSATPVVVKPITMTTWRPVANVPLLRYQDGAFSTVTVGGGVAWEYLQFNDSTGRWNAVVSLSPATILTGVNVNGQAFSISYAATAGFFNNLFSVGYGYDLTQKKTFFLVSVGINFNN